MKQNCWEFKKCGRQPGGDKVQEHGVCPAAIDLDIHGINSGINGGRACWVIEGTLCDGNVSSNFSRKLGTCLECDFYAEVRRQEGGSFKTSKQILVTINLKKAV